METLEPLSHRAAAVLVLLLGAVSPYACGAPASKPVTGPIADHVRAAIADGGEAFDHSEWDSLLAAGTRDGLVDYDYFSAHRIRLDSYLESIAGARLAALTGDHLMALLINAYNAYTVQSILDHPGIESIREIDGVWDQASHTVGGHEVTLDEIEHNLLRPFYNDPRIHVAVNCASMSCAPLPPWAFDGERLEEQLEEWTRAFFRDPRYLRVDGDRLLVSKLLDWYGSDFTAAASQPRADSLTEFIARYAAPEAASFLAEETNVEVSFLDYDWSLNAARADD